MTLINNSNGNNSPNDQKNLQHFTEKVVADLGGAITAVLVYIGDKLGLYRAMADAGKPITSQELATITKTSERVVREWLANQWLYFIRCTDGEIFFTPRKCISISR